ncbi:conjugal transfer protein TraN [Endozoicomonas sp. 4G]|uniref:conjugal transfer protein TraN n=1 Tax=Endozoicomonas sp. 4G TaxID=2872754 RepID=UPI002078E0D9|nr:conjugal transfer protein TraN [Endozoicomonas sp. 4G]
MNAYAAEEVVKNHGEEATKTISQKILGDTGAMYFGYVMAAYTAYVVAVMVVQMIYECETEEFELAAKKEVKSCTYVGSYCDNEVLGLCIEKREAYCCYNSPLSRIINEQAIPQLGRSFGSPENPQCGGIAMDEIDQIDWSKIDLTEWMGLLAVSDMLPDINSIDLNSVTGSGNVLNIDGERTDTLTRTEERLEDTNVDQTRKDLARNMAFSVCPVGSNKVGDSCQYVTKEQVEAIKTPVYQCPANYTLSGNQCVGSQWQYQNKVVNYYAELLACAPISGQTASFDHVNNQCIYKASQKYIVDWGKTYTWTYPWGLSWDWLVSVVSPYTCENKYSDNVDVDASVDVWKLNKPYYTEGNCILQSDLGRQNALVMVSGKDSCPFGYQCSVSNAASDQTIEEYCPSGTEPYGNLCRKEVPETVAASFVKYNYSCNDGWTLDGEICERTVITEAPAEELNPLSQL